LEELARGAHLEVAKRLLGRFTALKDARLIGWVVL
jgi:hypothetical protein